MRSKKRFALSFRLSCIPLSFKVVLSANGSDELFSGYKVYDFIIERTRKLSQVPALLRTLTAAALASVPSNRLDQIMCSVRLPAAKRGALNQSLKRLRRLSREPSPGNVFDVYLSCWLAEHIQRLLGVYVNPRRLADQYRGVVADQISLWDFHHYLPEDILTKVDRMIMATSSEGGVP